MDDAPISKVRLLLYVIGSYALMLMTLCAGAAGQFLYWLLFDSFGRAEARNKRTLKNINDLKDDEHYAIIIGTGFSGLGVAIRLNQLGVNKYVVFERLDRIGGTWYANQYPGCACDVPSNLYSFSFEPNPKWSHFFSRQPEIGEYLEHVTDKYDIRRHIQFNTTVTELRWIENRQIWQVKTRSNHVEKTFFARFVITGQGPLSNASYPKDIPGLDQFQGQMCHTAEWDKSIDFTNKRVAVVGTGASAVQVVPELQKRGLKQLLVFQRTPAWVIPRADRAIGDWEKQLYARFPVLQKLIRGFVYWIRESTVLSFTYRLPVRYLNAGLVNFNLYRRVRDPELRKETNTKLRAGM